MLGWIAQGKTDAETRMVLGISPRTVAKHLEHIFDKLGVETRTAAVVRASKQRAVTVTRTRRRLPALERWRPSPSRCRACGRRAPGAGPAVRLARPCGASGGERNLCAGLSHAEAAPPKSVGLVVMAVPHQGG